MREDLDGHADAYADGFSYHDENLATLRSYAQRILESLRERSSLDLLSLGIGHQIVSRAILEGLGPRLQRYVVVEGSGQILSEYARRFPPPEHMQLVEGYFETCTLTGRFDAIEMGFVLEHVEDPDLVVRRFHDLLRPDGRLFVAVPNARSLHRRLGHAAGLLDDLFRLSPYDLQLGHRRYLDRGGLVDLLERNGFRPVRTEGILLKPLTTAQLGAVGLTPSIQQALLDVSRDMPDIANSLFIEAAP